MNQHVYNRNMPNKRGVAQIKLHSYEAYLTPSELESIWDMEQTVEFSFSQYFWVYINNKEEHLQPMN